MNPSIIFSYRNCQKANTEFMEALSKFIAMVCHCYVIVNTSFLTSFLFAISLLTYIWYPPVEKAINNKRKFYLKMLK